MQIGVTNDGGETHPYWTVGERFGWPDSAGCTALGERERFVERHDLARLGGTQD